MSDNKQYREDSVKRNGLVVFTVHLRVLRIVRHQPKKTNTIDKKNHKDGKLANSRRDISALSYILRLLFNNTFNYFFGLIVFGIFI